MQTKKLGAALRKRQLSLNLQPAEHINALSDSDLVECYTRCCRCQRPIFVDEVAAVRNAKTLQEFLTLCDIGLAAHRCRP